MKTQIARPASTADRSHRRGMPLSALAIGVGGLLLLSLLAFLTAEGLWFAELDYSAIFSTRLWTQGLLGGWGFLSSLGFLGINLAIAQKLAHRDPRQLNDRPVLLGELRFRWLLPLVLLLSLLIGLWLLHHGRVTLAHWHPEAPLASTAASPERFRWRVLWPLGQQWLAQSAGAIGAIGLSGALLLYPSVLLGSIAVLASLGFALVLSEHWTTLLLALNPVSFQQLEPLFQHDISLYVFRLPLAELLEYWFFGLTLLNLCAVSLIALLSHQSLSQGRFLGFSRSQARQLCGAGGAFLLALAFGFWLDRYQLLYSQTGVVYGAGFTDVHVLLPVYTGLSLLALGLGLGLLAGQQFIARKPTTETLSPRLNPSSPIASRSAAPSLRSWTPAISPIAYPQPDLPNRFAAPPPPRSSPAWSRLPLGVGLYALLALVLGGLVPLVVQRAIVQPNELQLERPFLERTIALTRQAFNLDQIEVQAFNPQNNLTAASVQENEPTFRNIRVWDDRPLLQTNRQLQRIRSYYEFFDADLDRYSLIDNGETTPQQVLIAARELDYNGVPEAARTWTNKHLIYSHGYGFTVSPVNIAGEGGLPEYWVQGIESPVADPRIARSIPIAKPRIYYGELSNPYILAPTRIPELDYPSGSDNVYNHYSGRGGVPIGSVWQKLLLAAYLRDWRLLFSQELTPQTKLLFRRNIRDRVAAIAPFLQFDGDPYLVVANPEGEAWQRRADRQPASGSDPSYLYWVLDAYTTSDHYPYADPLTNEFNYIRNSVKIIVDAYHGSITFFNSDPTDPIIQAWSKIFPDLFQPIDQLPASLRAHLRYPQDLYRVQSNQLMTYHMTDPIVFYNREDQWREPNEIYDGKPQSVQPYYAILKLLTGIKEEFALLLPFTPVQRTNLVAWLAARSDGDNYGKLLLYTFPKQQLIFGTEQIEARINQDPVISQQISLWNRQGSRAIQGNLLVIPIDQALLYVEPLYLEAEQNQLPTLARVIVSYGNRIVMAETLERAIAAIFQAPQQAPQTEPVIRSIDPAIPVPDPITPVPD